jgi:hypothetical protein
MGPLWILGDVFIGVTMWMLKMVLTVCRALTTIFDTEHNQLDFSKAG